MALFTVLVFQLVVADEVERFVVFYSLRHDSGHIVCFFYIFPSVLLIEAS